MQRHMRKTWFQEKDPHHTDLLFYDQSVRETKFIYQIIVDSKTCTAKLWLPKIDKSHIFL